MKRMQTLAAGIVRDIEFSSESALETYLEKDVRCRYEILDRFDPEDGSVIVRIVKAYFDYPLIQL